MGCRWGVDGIIVTITVENVVEPPSQPGAPEVTSTGPTGLTVSWTAPDNQGPEITDYDLQYREADGEFKDVGYDGTGTSMTLSDLNRYFPDGIQCFHKHTILRQSRL